MNLERTSVGIVVAVPSCFGLVFEGGRMAAFQYLG